MTTVNVNLSTCIKKALDVAAPDGDSHERGQEVFWRELPNGSIAQALHKVLDASAPDKDSWKAGEAAFVASLTINTSQPRPPTSTWRPRPAASAAGSRAKSALSQAFGPRHKN